MRALLSVVTILCVSTELFAQRRGDTVEEHIQMAQHAQSHQDCHTAAREYAVVARRLPSSAEVRSNLGVALYCDNQLPEAISAFERALELKPNLIAPHLFLGLASYRLSYRDRAVKELQQAVLLNASDATAHTWLGYAYVSQSKYDSAIKEFNEAERLDPSNIDVRYALGQSYLEIGRQKARELISVAPRSGLVWKLAGEQYELSGDQERALAAFAEARKRTSGAISPPAEESLYRQAHDAEAASQAAFQWLIQYAPDSYRAHQIMAESLIARQDPDSAIAEYRTVLALNPTLPGIHEAISNCLMQGSHFADALSELRIEQALQPRSAEVLTSIARVQLALADDTGAEASLRQATTLGDAPPQAYLLLAKAKLRNGDAPSAISLLNRFLTYSSDNSLAYYLLARAYRSINDREKMNLAIASYKQTSRDENDRRLIQAQIETPSSQQAVLNAQETKDADILASVHP